jgi:vacuolar-type H+-ATPase subunit E/Vma4
MELDEVSDAIMNNVTKALQTEQDKAKKEAEYNQQIEDKLTADPNVVDDASMEAAMNKLKVSNGPKVYQPSLFEAVLIHNANHMPDASATEVMTETIHEYTLWNVMKTLRLENFTPELICKTANSYVID